MKKQSDIRPLVCFAVKEEAVDFKCSHVETVVSGMGKENALAAIEAILAHRQPKFVITSGFAGGLSEDLKHGSVIGNWDLDFPLISQLELSGVKRVAFHCADRVAITRMEKSSLLASTKMDAVEMESGAIRKLCLGENIPSATVRVISDSAGQDLPLDFNRLMNCDRTMNYFKLAAALIKSPLKIPKLIQFSVQVKLAARELGRTLNKVLAES